MKKIVCFILCASMALSMVLSGCAGSKNSGGGDEVSNVGDRDEVNDGASTDTKAEPIFENITKEPRIGFMVEGQPTEEVGEKTPIYTLDDLENMEQKGNYILMADIDCAGSNYKVKNFKGSFDGNFHQLQNRSVPLFDSIYEGTVANLAIVDTSSDTAGLVNQFCKGTIDNCYVTGEIGKEDDKNAACGGLVQYLFGANCYISNCYNAADIYNIVDGIGDRDVFLSIPGCGGIAGAVEYNGYAQYEADVMEFRNCENYGTIYGEGKRSTGGIIGNLHAEENGSASYKISGCTNYGGIEIKGEERYEGTSGILGTGGIVGTVNGRIQHADCSMEIIISSCSNYGSLSNEGSSVAVAGICGCIAVDAGQDEPVTFEISDCLNSCSSIEDMGGMCHTVDICYTQAIVRSCIDLSGSCNPVYAHTEPNVPTMEGTLTASNCYFLKYDDSDVASDAVGLSPEKMRSKESLEGFSFVGEGGSGIWDIDVNFHNGYPYIVDSDQAAEVYQRVTEEKEAESDAAAEEALNAEDEDTIQLKKHYADMLASIGLGGYWPEDESRTYQQYLPEYNNDNSFSICDIDGDGIEELLVEEVTGSMAEMRFVIYQYDLDGNRVIVKFEEFIGAKFYDNGILIDEYSHNQGLGTAIMPYNVYQYDKKQDTYVNSGYADSWDKEYSDTDWDGNPFPTDIDSDGDGHVYFIGDADGNERIVDGPEYVKWQESLIGSAKEMEIDWQKIKSDNYSAYTKTYLQYYLAKAEEEKGFDATDLGYVYMKNNGSLDAVKETMSSEYKIDLQETEELEEIGTYDGQEVISVWKEDGGSIVYRNRKVGDMCLFGVYPGMKSSELGEKLKKYGFEFNNDGYYSTGDASGNFYINYMEEGGVIQSITVYQGSRYTG